MPETYGLPEDEGPSRAEQARYYANEAIAGASVQRTVILYGAIACFMLLGVPVLAIPLLILLSIGDPRLS